MTRLTTLVVALSFAAARLVSAQPAAVDQGALLIEHWNATFARVLAQRGLQLVNAEGNPVAPGVRAHRVLGDLAAVRAAYEEAIATLVQDPALQDLFRADPRLVQQTVRPTDREWIALLAASGVGEKSAKTVNAASTNPAAARVAERSGFTDLVALALDTKNIVASNDSAISVNLNALALVGLNSQRESAPLLYRRHDTLRRLGGTFTFGAKLPEGEITGLTGLPSASKLLNVFAWDARVRVYGDRDARAQRWYDVMLGVLGGLGELSANLLGLVPIGDAPVVQTLLEKRYGDAVALVKKRLSKSAQVTVKLAGHHLTEDQGKNKYSVGVLADKGFGDTDLTVNSLFSVVDDISLPNSPVAALKTWTLTVGLNHLAAQNVLVQGRALEFSINANFEVPFGDDASFTIERDNVWRLIGAVSVPWGDAAKIPVSVTLTSDPSKLGKGKFVTGHLGISYDFGALKSLFRPLTSAAQ